ncbi:exosortase H-associated membrane protein [Dokdonella ginsengisoli]|uniref:Exosortase H-associated membrane protein n=1 Tax=Dokdonella ginsengisoli TaxID=363846 RepID=A0ABV9QRQ6_9GAMM
MRLSPIREFALKALLWLPLCFVVWFWLAPLWVQPAVALARMMLLGMWNELFTAVVQGGEILDAGGKVVAHAGYLVQLTTTVVVTIPAGPGGPGGVGVLEPTINPMVYGYSLPLFSGLAMATPLNMRRRLVQMLFAFLAIWLAQACGVVAESLKVIAFDSGAEGAAAAARAGLAPNAIAFAYQFGYLILPAVVPAALWIGLNQAFIERLVRPAREPEGESRGQNSA